MAFGGFDFLAAEKDMSKKVEELAQVLERVATIFLNGVGALEKQLDEMRTRLSKIETQVDTVLRIGGTRAMAPSTGTPDATEAPLTPPPSPRMPPATPAGPSAPPGMAAPPPGTPTSPMAATGGIGIRAQMQGELQSFLQRRRAQLEAALEDEK